MAAIIILFGISHCALYHMGPPNPKWWMGRSLGKPENFDRVYYSLDRLTGPEFNFKKYTWDGK